MRKAISPKELRNFRIIPYRKPEYNKFHLEFDWTQFHGKEKHRNGLGEKKNNNKTTTEIFIR